MDLEYILSSSDILDPKAQMLNTKFREQYKLSGLGSKKKINQEGFSKYEHVMVRILPSKE